LSIYEFEFELMAQKVTVPLPPLTVNISRMDMKNATLTISQGGISLKPNMQKVGHISTMISTGGGFRQIGVLNEREHKYVGGDMLLNKYILDEECVVGRAVLSISFEIKGEVRPAGVAWIHVGELLEAACSSDSLVVSGYLYVNDGKSPVTPIQVEITPDPSSAPTIKAWCGNEGKQTFRMLMNRTFDTNQMSKELTHYMEARRLALHKKLNGTCGHLDTQVTIASITTPQDTGGIRLAVDPASRELILKEYQNFESINRKRALKVAEKVLSTVSEYFLWSSGRESIDVGFIQQELNKYFNGSSERERNIDRQMIQKKQKITFEQATKIGQLWMDASTRLAFMKYRNDEDFEVNSEGNLFQNLEKVGEKEDLAGGLCWEHYDKYVKEWIALNEECKSLLKEKSQLLSAPAFNRQNEIETRHTRMEVIRNNIWGENGDCEDLAAGVTTDYWLVKNRPKIMSSFTLPYVGKQILNSSSDSSSVQMNLRSSPCFDVQTKQELWPLMFQFVSDAFQIRDRGENGFTNEVVNSICLASGASLKTMNERSQGLNKPIERGDFPSYAHFLQGLCGDQQGGHACPLDVQFGPKKEFINEGEVVASICSATVLKSGILEATKPCKIDRSVKSNNNTSIVDLNISMGKMQVDLKEMPLNVAKNVVYKACETQINSSLTARNAGYLCAIPLEIQAASKFYTAWSSLGSAFCISGEFRDDATGRIISADMKNVQTMITEQRENARYNVSKIAWNLEYGKGESNETNCLCVDFECSPREKDLVKIMCAELEPSQGMGQEHLDALMNMGVFIECGWNNGRYTSMQSKVPAGSTKIALEMLVRNENGSISAADVMQCVTVEDVKQKHVGNILHHLSATLDMDCRGASFRWINQDLGLVQNVVIDFGQSVA